MLRILKQICRLCGSPRCSGRESPGLILTKNFHLAVLLTLVACSQEAPQEAFESEPETPVVAEQPHPGEEPYMEHCASCHDVDTYKAPHRWFLGMMAPDAILKSMDGIMAAQAAGLSDQQRINVAEYLAGRSLASVVVEYAPPACAQVDLDMDQPPHQAGWGVDLTNTRFQGAESGGLSADQVGELELKWAFAFPNDIRARSQPAVAGDTVFVGSQSGKVYALDKQTGCVRWTFHATAEVRTAIVVSPWEAGSKDARPRVYFGDLLARAYALDARSGELIWKTKVDGHPNATITGSPVLVEDQLLVPVSSLEVVPAADPSYACCTFRGSVVAIDTGSGEINWQSFAIDEEPAEVGKTSVGTAILAPSGAPIWNSPTIDLKRGQFYSGTGENYSSPADGRSDAIIAIDIKTGAKRWVFQATAGDAFNAACLIYFADSPANCPEENGPDFDFGAASMLVELEEGRDILVAGQKSGSVFGINPDDGTIIWRAKVGRGGVQGGVHFGMAAAGSVVYVPINDMFYPEDLTRYTYEIEQRPGIYALDAATGKEIWARPADDVCPDDVKEYCDPGISAAVTAIPGGVIAGHLDGRLRIYSAADGEVLWEFNTLGEFDTVSGETARGGSISGSGPVVADGMLYVNSGYGIFEHIPGNVLLAFGLDRTPAR